MENNRICKKCGGISGWDSYFQSWVCTRCGDMVQKRITNGDKIRQMKDDELANFIWRMVDCKKCMRLFGTEKCLTTPSLMCKEVWYHWLKDEAK